MGRFQKYISALALSVMVLGLAVVASAQYRDRRGNNDYYGNQDISSTIKRLRDDARKFEKTLDRELDRSRLDGSQREDNLNSLAGRFKDAAEDLDDEYEGYRSMNSSSDEARRVLDTAARLDNGLMSSRIGRNNFALSSNWSSIEQHLRVISRVYNYNYNGRYGGNGSYGRTNDGYRNNRGNNGRYRNNRGNNGRYGNNRGNNGRYGNVGSTIANLKSKARNLEDRLDQDRYDRNGSNLEGLSDRFKNAVDDLHKNYGDRDGGYDEVQRVLNLGSQLDAEMSRSRVGRSVRNDWRSIENDLQTIARAYNLNYRGNNGRRSIGDIFRRLPF